MNCLVFACIALWRLRARGGSIYYRRSYGGSYSHFCWCDRFPNPRHIISFVPVRPRRAAWWQVLVFEGYMRWGDEGPYPLLRRKKGATEASP